MANPTTTFINLSKEEVTKLEDSASIFFQYSRRGLLILAMKDSKDVNNEKFPTLWIDGNDLYQLKKYKILAKQTFCFLYNDNPFVKITFVDSRQNFLDTIKDKNLDILHGILKFIDMLVAQSGNDESYDPSNITKPTTTAEALETIKKRFKFFPDFCVPQGEKEEFIQSLVSPENEITREVAELIASIVVEKK